MRNRIKNIEEFSLKENNAIRYYLFARQAIILLNDSCAL